MKVCPLYEDQAQNILVLIFQSKSISCLHQLFSGITLFFEHSLSQASQIEHFVIFSCP